ncbi:hypothetical protein AB0M87_10580 [Streptomyces sp. NPDC051320]|uniref:hypothetical protein n=1 Tax=Streptomyces sp. NPDC051320 TaxID=3154644 RepID=UPI0034130C9E
MSDRKVDAVRRLLEGPHPPVPAGLTIRAAEQGSRMLRRRVAGRWALWLVLTTALVVFVVWVTVAQPWAVPPSQVTPPVEGIP